MKHRKNPIAICLYGFPLLFDYTFSVTAIFDGYGLFLVPILVFFHVSFKFYSIHLKIFTIVEWPIIVLPLFYVKIKSVVFLLGVTMGKCYSMNLVFEKLESLFS